jgi:arginyl-tRNA--protein-N-Asp/Glu arginylyltransferase
MYVLEKGREMLLTHVQKRHSMEAKSILNKHIQRRGVVFFYNPNFINHLATCISVDFQAQRTTTR